MYDDFVKKTELIDPAQRLMEFMKLRHEEISAAMYDTIVDPLVATYQQRSATQ